MVRVIEVVVSMAWIRCKDTNTTTITITTYANDKINSHQAWPYQYLLWVEAASASSYFGTTLKTIGNWKALFFNVILRLIQPI